MAELSSDKPKYFELVNSLKSKVGNIKADKAEMFLQKLLSRIRVLILKAEHKINGWLSHLRQKSLNKKSSSLNDYWQKFKK